MLSSRCAALAHRLRRTTARWLRQAALLAAAGAAMVSAGIAHADAPAPVTFPNTGAFSARLAAVRNNVAVVELTGNYARDLTPGEFNVEPRTLITKEFYKAFADHYDFIVVFSNFEFPTGMATAYYVGARNDVQGIGERIYDNSSFWGSSSGRLQGFIEMAAMSRYELEPTSPRFEDVMRVMSHELLHRWGSRVRFIDDNGQTSTALIGRDGSHWSFLMDNGGSVEYGNRWADNGDGTFTSQPSRQYFSPIDLYLMGMLKREEVPPFAYLVSPGIDVTRLPEAGVRVPAVRRTVTIDQVIAAEGPRVPDAQASQKEFRLGFVLLTRPGTEVTDLDVQRIGNVREAFQARLASLTGGRAIAHVHLDPKPGAAALDPTLATPVLGSPGSNANVASALGWLRGKQETAGAWSDNPLTRLRDTVVATGAMAQAGGGASSVERALGWLGQQQFTNTDYVARRIAALGAAATEADWSRLAAAQNGDGGFGVAPGYSSTPLDTALAVATMAQDPNSARQSQVRSRARTFLLAKQNTDGGWSHAVAGASRTATTAQVLRALSTLDAPESVTRAVQFLAGRQNTDGGFGDSPSTTHDTSNAIQALAAVGQLASIRVADGFAFLNATQRPDGSWDGSVYATGLAVATLGTAQSFNWTASLMAAQPTAVRDGQRVALSLTVANTGVAAAPATTVKIYDGDPAAGLVLLELPVPALAPGALAQVKGSWNTFGKAGNHLLNAVVDPAATAAEMTRGDNVASVRVAVSPAPPGVDVTLSAADVQVLPGTVDRLPSAVSVLAQVSNVGLTDAPGVRLRLFAGPVGGTQVLVDEKTVNLLGRSTVPVSTTFQVTLPGRQQLSVVADNVAGDIDGTNNRADVFIETQGTFDPAVAAGDLVVPATPVAVGRDIELKATVRNQGTLDSPPFLAVFTVGDGSTVREVARQTLQLPPGGSRAITLPWRVDLVGNLEFKVTLDPAGAVSDLDRTNNVAVAAFITTAAPAGPNLAVNFRDFTIQPDPADEGRPLVVKALVRNTGTQAATAVEVGFYEGDPAAGGTLLAPLQVLPSVAAGASVEVSATVPTVLGNAQRLYFVAVDPAAKLAETSRDDNSAFRTVDVAPLPDLAVSAGAVLLEPVAPRPGDALSVTVTVQNLGGQPVGPVPVRLQAGAGITIEQTIPSIAARASATLRFAVTLPAQGMADALTVSVDPAATLPDSDRGNNVALRPLVVQTGAGFVTEPFFSPDGDGIKDLTAFGFRIAAPQVTRVVAVDAAGKVVRSFTLAGAPVAEGSVSWDGRDDDGRIARDGRYRFRALAADGSAPAEAEVVLDTNRTPILRASGTEFEYYRNLSCRATGVSDWTTSLDEQSVFLFSPINASQPGLQGLLRVALQGGETTTVVPQAFIANAANAYLYNLSASARGEVLAFSRSFSVNNQYTTEVWSVGGDGSGLRRLALSGGTGVPADLAFNSLYRLVTSHDGKHVILQLWSSTGGDQIRRVSVATGESTTLLRGPEKGVANIQQLWVAPNRRRAVLRAYDTATGTPNFYLLDFETGEFIPAPAGLYPGPGYLANVKWAPDSSRFLLYGSLSDLGLDASNNLDFEFDVFDADFQLAKRFRTDHGSGNTAWYGSAIDGPEWSSAGDEFVFGFNPEPFWYGGESVGRAVSAAAAIGGSTSPKRFFRASVTQGTLTELPVDYAQIGWQGSDSQLWWGPNDRLAATRVPNDRGHAAIDVDSGALSSLFSNWWQPTANPNGYEMSLERFAPSGRRLYFSSYRDGTNPASACYSPNSSFQLYTYESLQNLVADLQPLRDPRVGGIVMRGTATDANLAGWRLEYAATTAPNVWRAVAVPGSEQKVGAKLATWVPPAYGSYFVRLVVEDRAGNTAVAQRRVNWADTPPITDLIKDLDYISPNGDGVQDKLTLSYRVLEPVHLAFEVKREDGTRVRLVERDHAVVGSNFAFEWDGRDDQGRFVADGKYTVRVLDFEFDVVVDTAFPQVEVTDAEHAFQYLALSPSVGTQGLEFDAEVLRTGAPTLKFYVPDGRSANIRLIDAAGIPVIGRSFGPGNVEVAWNGRNGLTPAEATSSDGPLYPDGTYLLEVQVGQITIASFTLELVREAGAVTTRVRPVMLTQGDPLAQLAPFSLRVADPLLDFSSVEASFGYGDPPASWTPGVGNGTSLSVPQGWTMGVSFEGSGTPLPSATVSGRRTSQLFAGSRVRIGAQDRAGNRVTEVSPYVVTREAVLESGTATLWPPSDPVDVFQGRVMGSTNFQAAPVPALMEAEPKRNGKLLGALDLAFLDNLPVPAARVELRYAFVPAPVATGSNVPPEQRVFVVPPESRLNQLSWSTVPLRGLGPLESSPGISELVDQGNRIAFRWRTPRQASGTWLYQLVYRDAGQPELRSSVYWTTQVSSINLSPPLAARWTAWHEPAQACGAQPTEIAHIELADIAGTLRLVRLLPGGVRESMDAAARGNLEWAFSTADWPLGRHDFVVEQRDALGEWKQVVAPYLYVNHEPPQVQLTSPVEGQKMCAMRVEAAGIGTIGYVPVAQRVSDPYGVYVGTERDKAGNWVGTGPVGETGMAACALPDGCRYQGPIEWPAKPGSTALPPSARVWGLAPDNGSALNPDPLDGVVPIRLRAWGVSGHQVCRAVTVEVDGRVDASVSVDRVLFSPNGDGQFDDETLTVSAAEAVTVTVDVVRATFNATTGELRIADEQPVAVLATNLQVLSGDRLFTWDGRLASGQVAADGVYALRVKMVDGCGNEVVRVLRAEVDNTPPTVTIDSPLPNAQAPLDIVVKGGTYDLHPLRYEVVGIVDNLPDAPYGLPSLAPVNQQHVDLARWNIAGLTGSARIVVRAFDAVANVREVVIPVTLLTPPELVASLLVTPDPFSPNGDGRRERATVQYQLLQPATITLDIVRRSSGQKVRTLVQAVPAPAGIGAAVWDGRNTGGVVEADGDMVAVLTAEAFNANGDPIARQTERTGFVLDATPPVLSFQQPDRPVTTGSSGASARAVDPLLAEAQLAVSIAGGAYEPLADAQDGSGALAASLDTLPEGPATLRVTASDRAENQATKTLSVIIDRTPPKVAVAVPAPGTHVSGRKQHLKIEGSIDELHLARWELRLDAATLGQGTTLPATPTLLDWDPLTAPDGPATLSLRADDQAGLNGMVNVPIVIDNTPPVAAIRATGSPMYLRNGTPIAGTASDLNIAGWRLDLTPGGSTGTRWTEMGRGAAEVADTTITALPALPPDGTYGLRLTVVDKAGNESAALQDVVVDNTAPPTVALTAAVENRRDARVRWNVSSASDVAGYILLRNGSRVSPQLITDTTYIDPGLAAGTYRYVVKAVDRAGNESEPSNEGSVVVSGSEPVAQIFAPTNDAWTAGIADVRGTASSPADFKEYRLYVGTGTAPTSWQLLRRSPLAITADVLAAWNTTSLAEGASYTLKLEAEDLSGVVATDRVTVKVKNTPPRAPLQLAGTLTVNNVALTWNANTEPDIQGYLVYRDQRLANATGLVIGSLVPYLVKPNAYNDVSVPDGRHRWFVQAMDLAGNVSDPSNEVEFTIDTRPPHVAISKPADGAKASQTITLVGESPDTDLRTVQYQFRPEGNGAWTDIGAALTTASGPWTLEWDVSALAYGRYQVRAVGTDLGGKVDPAPGFITLVITDLRKPDAPATLAARVTGGDVALSWAASASSYAVGYHVERFNPNGTVTRLTGTPLAGLALTDAGLADAWYAYRVIAVSAGGTESDPSNNAPALVYTPLVDQPFTPTAATTVDLPGTVPSAALRITLRPQGGGATIAEATADDTGAFRFDALPLALGDNRYELVGSDSAGNTSKPARLRVLRGVAPAAPTGLAATVTGRDATLTWAANTEADLAGYVAARDGVRRSRTATPSQALASSEYPSSFGRAVNAIDNNVNTSWQPSYDVPMVGQWLELRFASPQLLRGATLTWTWATPSRARLEAFDGEVWVPLATVDNATMASSFDVQFAQPYRSDRLRVLVQGAPYGVVQLVEFGATALDVQTARSATFSNLPDGYADLGVVATSTLGLISPLSQLRPAVGDVVPPGAPALQASAQGSDALLSWTPPADGDVAGYQLWRDGVLVVTLPPDARAYTDAALANGHYDYVLRAVDAVGNAGAPSNTAGVDIAVAGPAAPITAQAAAPAGGGLVQVSWTVGSGPQPASFALMRRAADEAGFTLRAQGITGTSFDDTEVRNGVRYFYVVRGQDALGNTGAASNEVNALPVDRLPPAAPFLVQPGRAPGPVTVNAPTTLLAGYAEPGVRVVITQAGARLAEVQASAQADRFGLSSRWWNVFDMTPDGQLLLGGDGNRNVVSTFDGEIVPSASLGNDNNVNGLRFAPDGQSAAFTHYDNTRFRTTLMRWNRATDTVSLVSALAEAGAMAFSADGRWLATRAWDDDRGVQGLLVVDWAGGDTRFVDGEFNVLAWAPDNRFIALGGADGVRLVDRTGQQPDRALASLPDVSSLAWLPDGSALLAEAPGATGNRSVQRVNLADGAVSALADSANRGYTMPTVSPEGDAYLALSAGQLVRRDFAGNETVVIEQASDGYWPPIWSSAGTIAYPVWGSPNVHVPAGRFTLPDTALAVGSNVFSAFAVDGSGNTSGAAPALEVRRNGAGLPDWQLGADSWTLFPATPQAGEAASVFVTVRNAGAAAPAVPLNVVAQDAQGVVTVLGTVTLAPIAAGGSQTVTLPWTPPAAGRYTLSALVNPGAALAELSSADNRSTREVVIAATGGRPELQVATTQARYAGGASVQASVVALNPGAAFDGSLAARIVDAQGFEVTRFDLKPVSGLVFGTPQTFSYTWPSGATLAGDYRVVADLVAGDGTVVTSGAAPFALDAGVVLAATLASDRAAYVVGDSVALRGSVRYVSGNVASFDAPASLVVKNAAGDVVASRSVALQGLLAGAEVRVDLTLPAAAIGLYNATLATGPADAPLAQAQAGYEVGAPVLPVVTGKLALANDVLATTEVIAGTATLANSGAPLSPLPVRVRAVATSGQTLATWAADVLGLGAAPQVQPLTLAATWPLGSFEVRLESLVGGNWLLLDRARVQAAEQTPPRVAFTAPAAAAVVKSSTLLAVQATVQQAPIARVEISRDGSTWQPLAPAGGGSGLYQGIGLPAVDGPVTMQARAADTLGNVSAIATLAVVVDDTPPAIGITGVDEGGRYRGSATPVVTVTELHPGTQSVLLDGQPYVSGTPVTTAGAHTLAITATDAAGNTSSRSLGFEVEAVVSLNGSLLVAPTTAPLGSSVVFDARVVNAGAAQSGVQVVLTLRDRSSGSVLRSFTTTTDIATGATWQTAWSWTAAGTVGAFVDAELTAVVAGTTLPIASGSLQLAAPAARVEYAEQLAPVKKLLVYRRCTLLEDEVWDNCGTALRAYSNPATVATCTRDYASWLDLWLTSQGVAHTLVTDEASFLRELRSGEYSTYWLGGAALRLGSLASAEVQAAVLRGDTLITEGWSAGRSPSVDAPAGVGFLGRWSSLQATLNVSGGALPTATLIVNAPMRLSSTGTRHATMNNGHGIVSSSYGRGRNLAFAFDLTGTLRAASPSTLDTWNRVMAAAFGLVERTAPLEVVAGGRFNLVADIRNAGTAALAYELVDQGPGAATLLTTVPAATATGTEGGLPTARWNTSAAADEAKRFTSQWKAPLLAGSYVMAGRVSQVNADNSTTLLQDRQTVVPVAGPADRVQAALDTTQALSLPEPGASAKTQALQALNLAKMAVADGRWDDALRQLVGAQASLAPATGTAADAAKLDVARAIEAVERRL